MRSLLSIFFALLFCLSASAEDEKKTTVDSYIHLSKEGMVLYEQGRHNRDNPECLKIVDKLYKLEMAKGNKRGCCNAICLKMQYYNLQYKEKEFLAAVSELRKLAKSVEDHTMFYYSYYAECEYYIETNRSLKALNLIRSLTTEEKKHPSPYASFFIDVSLGNIYLARRDEVHANDYYLGAVDKSKELNISSSLPPVFLNLARITEAKDVFTREKYLHDALKYSINPTDSAAALMGLAHLYSYQNNTKRFWTTYEEYQPLLDREKMAQTKYEKWYKANEAYRLTLEGKTDSAAIMRQSISNPYYRYQAQADFYSTNGDYKMACLYFDSLMTFMRSSQSEQNVSDVAEIAAVYENEHLKTEAKEMQQDFTRSILTTALICVLLVLVILVIWMLRRHAFINRLEEMSQELRQARDDAVKASKMKDVFIQNMSHEVRTPLNAVTGFAQLLALPEECFEQNERQEFIQHIQSNTHMLTMLIDDILNISDIESGNYHMEITSCSVNEICHTAVSTVTYRVVDTVKMTFETDMEDDFHIATDARRVQQVLINFLTNAIKHTIEGTIVLNASLKENPGFVTFSVADTGEGVPKDKMDAIFNRFEKLNAFVQGTGLGLNICRMIAEKLNGSVEIDKTYPDAYEGVEHGARFVFKLPLE